MTAGVLKKWLINISEIQPGRSAVLNDNYFAFYGIHTIAITLILISFLSSIILIAYILASSKKRWDFPDRFPLYLAIANALYCVLVLFGHVILLSTKCLPKSVVAEWLSINCFIVMGYEQFLHTGLATYTYLKVVRQTPLNLGRAEWKLHLICFTFLGVLVTIFYILDSFGNSGYWFLADVKNNAGVSLGFTISICATIHAACTSVSFWSIKRKVEAHNNRISIYSVGTLPRNESGGRPSIVTECLTTYIRISLHLYCPLAVAFWIYIILAAIGVIEPLNVLFIVSIANSRGWVNALGFWHNKRIKDIRTKIPLIVLTESNNRFY